MSYDDDDVPDYLPDRIWSRDTYVADLTGLVYLGAGATVTDWSGSELGAWDVPRSLRADLDVLQITGCLDAPA